MWAQSRRGGMGPLCLPPWICPCTHIHTHAHTHVHTHTRAHVHTHTRTHTHTHTHSHRPLLFMLSMIVIIFFNQVVDSLSSSFDMKSGILPCKWLISPTVSCPLKAINNLVSYPGYVGWVRGYKHPSLGKASE